ncbi:hypothetical protein [Synechococcus sp. FACHB-909]|uniref:hypothetical protein n=1 Tax=Synechococcus sp. FACHB-909 TaxID=2692863 RepID=UPI00168227C3|nr:hypothetical protein [Synechococcus sp. FACHB-909]MBD2720224.1 hypothetical protein [Synechococcus sp. FACHB-909]
MLPTLAERLREQHAKTRGRRPARPPWPVPGEPPTALLFQARPELEPAAVPMGPAVPTAAPMADPDPLPRVSAVVVTEIARPELVAPLPTVPPAPAPPLTVPERTALAELLLLLVWAVLVVIDGALALASLIDRAAGRPRRPQADAASAPPSAAPPFLMAAAAP